MNRKAIQLLAVVATFLVIATGVSRLREGPVPTADKSTQKKTVASNTKPGELPCTIKRAAFGGTSQTSLLKATKGKTIHYIVMDRPQDNPIMPFWQRDWLEANYGTATPTVVGDFPTVEAAISRAASLCKRN